MEKQSFELITGMQRRMRVHTLALREGESRLWFFGQLERRINEIIAAHPDIRIIHFNDALVAAVAMRHTSYTHLKRVVTVHGLDVVFPQKTYQTRILPRFNQFDALIAVSNATRTACVERGIDPHRILTVPNGVDHMIQHMAPAYTRAQLAERYGFDDRRPLIVAMGRAVRRKGFSWFLRTVLPKLHPDVQVCFIGPFDERPEILERILSLLPQRTRNVIELFLGFPSDQAALRTLLPQHPQARHLGKLPYDDLVSMLKCADAFVMPNLSVAGDIEGFGLVCLEAALAGAPVFAAATDGITDAIQHEKNGFLLPPADAQAWADALTQALNDPKTLKQQAVDFQRFTREHYGWEKMVDGYAAVFERLCTTPLPQTD